jgi:hypothetical protein
MDETPIKAGRGEPGKLNAAYFWPVYGEWDEVCFPFFESRRAEHVEQALGLTHAQGAVLLSDGYAAYTRYANKTGLTHAQCWAHTRREFFEAQAVEPHAAARALAFIGGLYAVEACIRDQKLTAAKKLDYRLTHAKPIVEQFFAWINQPFEAQGLLPSNPMTQALADARERRVGLEVDLTHPSSGESPSRDSHGSQGMAVLLDRTGRQVRRDQAQPDRDLPATRHRPLRLSGRCVAACRPASGQTRLRTHSGDCGSLCSLPILCDRPCTRFANRQERPVAAGSIVVAPRGDLRGGPFPSSRARREVRRWLTGYGAPNTCSP